MAEALLRRRLAEIGVPATVSSAGLYEGGAPATPDGVAAMASRGLELGGHVSRTITTELVEHAAIQLAVLTDAGGVDHAFLVAGWRHRISPSAST